MKRYFLNFDNIAFLKLGAFSQTFPLLIFPALLNFKIGAKANRFVVLEVSIYLYAIAISLIYLFFSPKYFLFPFMRQSISYFLGLVIFIYLLNDKRFFDIKKMTAAINVSVIAITIIAVYQFAVDGSRAQGFSTEPSHFGDILCLFMLPFLVIFRKQNRHFGLIISLLIICVLLTGSMTAYLKFLTFFAILAFLTHKFICLLLVFLSVIAFYVFLNSELDLYFVNMIKHDYAVLLSDDFSHLSGSMVDKFAILFLPLAFQNNSSMLIGAGFGCELSCFFPYADPWFAEAILNVKSNWPTLSPLHLKNIFYIGFVPFLINVSAYSFILISKFRRRLILNSECAAIIAVFLACFYSIGPFWLPYIWLWKAYLLKK